MSTVAVVVGDLPSQLGSICDELERHVDGLLNPPEPLSARIDRMVQHNRELTADARDHGWPANRAPGRHYAKRGTR